MTDPASVHDGAEHAADDAIVDAIDDGIDDDRVAVPEVSIIMPNFNCGAYVQASIRSALAQRGVTLEVIFVDDASTDDSVARARALAEEFPGRVQVHGQAVNQGSAVARNTALRHARGRWLAVLDSDDLMYPERLRRLIDVAEAAGADIVADDMLTFYDDGGRLPHPLLGGVDAAGPHWVSLAEFVDRNRFYSRHAPLGYLKPVFRADKWRASQVWYDDALRLAQDYDFLLRLLEAGMTFHVVPEPWYFYRKHSASNSHRLKVSHLEALLDADIAFAGRIGEGPARAAPVAEIERARRARHATIIDALGLDRLVSALKARQPLRALREGARHPRSAWWFVYYQTAKHLSAAARRIAPAGPVVGGADTVAVVAADASAANAPARLGALAGQLRRTGKRPVLVDAYGPGGDAPLFLRAARFAGFEGVVLNGWRRVGPWFVRTRRRRGALPYDPVLIARALGGGGSVLIESGDHDQACFALQADAAVRDMGAH